MLAKSNKVFVLGTKTPIILKDSDFMASGGEANIYRQQDTVFKIYYDSSKCIEQAKLRELQKLQHPDILAPTNLLINTKGTLIGYTMHYGKDTKSLAELFSPRFKITQNFSVQKITTLLHNMQEVIEFIHKHQCLIVDGNEMNYLVDSKTFVKPYFLDVDSYQTEHFPPTAFHPLTKDYFSKSLSKLTDWYSFSIVAFKLLTGIHPFRGSHPSFNRADIEGKMKNGISVFNKDVKLPPSASALSVIPTNYLDWFKALYVDNKRLSPPGIAGELVSVTLNVQRKRSSGKITITLIKDYGKQILNVQSYDDNLIVTTPENFILNHTVKIKNSADTIFFSNKNTKDTVMLSNIEGGRLTIAHKTYEIIWPVIKKIKSQFVIDNELFLITQDSILHMATQASLQKIFVTVGTNWKILPNSSKILEGLVFQNMLGTPYLNIPYMEKASNLAACAILRITELWGSTVISGRRIKNIIMLATYNGKEYEKFIFKFNEDFTNYTVRSVVTGDISGLNFTVLDIGIVVHITDNDSELEVFSTAFDKKSITVIQDKAITPEMQLFTHNGKALVSDRTKLKQLSLSA